MIRTAPKKQRQETNQGIKPKLRKAKPPPNATSMVLPNPNARSTRPCKRKRYNKMRINELDRTMRGTAEQGSKSNRQCNDTAPYTVALPLCMSAARCKISAPILLSQRTAKYDIEWMERHRANSLSSMRILKPRHPTPLAVDRISNV
jgi:hypothetical protein